MRRGQPVCLKTCEISLQANKTIEMGAKIIRKTVKPGIKSLTPVYYEFNRTRMGVRTLKEKKA